jgi:SAM-dependent methyltransferase
LPDSVSFDRAAGYYDRTRSLPDDLMRRTIALLSDLLPHDGLCLEVGVGTGRIALPLMREGVHVIGLDLSREMLRRLLANAGDGAPAIVHGDATRLPFREAIFSSALASHVLHLIPNWRAAVDELARVVMRGGVIAVSRGVRGPIRQQGVEEDDPWEQRVTRRFFLEAGDPPWPPGLDAMQELDDHMAAIGATAGESAELMSEGTSTVNERLHTLDAGYWAACWAIDPAVRSQAAARTREWAWEEFGDLDLRRTTYEGTMWRSYRLAE